MKVILLEDVKKVGKKDDILEVSDGYANNYLLKNKLAVIYTKRSKEVLDKELDMKAQNEALKIQAYEKIKNSLENKELIFKVKVGEQDKVFGKISSKQIASSLQNLGFNIDKKNIILTTDLDCLGTHQVLIKLHKKVEFKINVILSK